MPSKRQVQLTELLPLMHLNIEQAAAEMGMSTPSFKRLCLRINLRKWPARQVRSVQRLSSMLQQGKSLTPSLQQKFIRVQEQLSALHPDLPQMYLCNKSAASPAVTTSPGVDSHLQAAWHGQWPLQIPQIPTAADQHLKALCKIPLYPW